MIHWILENRDMIGTLTAIIGSIVAIAAFLLSFASLAFSAYRFVKVRQEEQRQRRFENYHKLIAELVGGARDKQVMKLDSQIAVIYELRNFKEYSEVTVRILNGLIKEWTNESKPRLMEELNLTVKALS